MAFNNIVKQEGHDGPGVAHLSLLTKHNQFPTSCEIYVLPNSKILNSSVWTFRIKQIICGSSYWTGLSKG